MRFQGLQRIGLGACALVWEYIYKDTPTPRAVQLLAEYDVWDHSDADCLPFQYGMQSPWPNPENDVFWRSLFKNDEGLLRVILNEGQQHLKWKTEQRKLTAASLSFVTEFEGLKLLAANAGPDSSQFFDSIDQADCDALCLFFWNPKTNDWAVNLYTNDEGVDVGTIAARHEGGGHHNAAGFHCAELPFKLTGVRP
jgi:oligoribonuclease NrnB/cAMP/cGMP phosphodiesterase (DHH superfamily)